MPRRILTLGPCGAGKSTLAKLMADQLELPAFHMDRLFWKPGWVESGHVELRGKVAAVVSRDAWIIDGNYSGTLNLRLARAELVIWLDLPRYVYFPSALWRTIRYYGRTRSDIGPDCPDRFDPKFFLDWVWTYPHRARAGHAALIANLPEGVRGLTLRSRREVRHFVAGFTGSLTGAA